MRRPTNRPSQRQPVSGQSAPGLSRRRFLSGLAVLGLTPLCPSSTALSFFQPARAFTGDDLDEAHRLLMDPAQILAGAARDTDATRYDLVIVGAGISGLATAHFAGDRKMLILEREPQTGGVCKSDTWNGIEYALGAAYVIDPDPESEDTRERRGFELLRDLGLRTADEDIERDRSLGRRLGGADSHCLFTNTRVLSETHVYGPRFARFFEHVLDSDRYPSVPAEDADLVKALDTISFEQFVSNAALQRRLYGRSIGPITSRGREAIEYYFWGAFGTTARETSAYHGLNFFAAEYGSTLIFPGGNAAITRALTASVGRRAGTQIRTGAWVLRVEPKEGGYAIESYEQGKVRSYTARTVVYASPLFLAPTLMPWLPEAQRAAIGTLQYRAYVVANLLLRRGADRIFGHPALRNGYELTRLHEADLSRQATEKLSKAKVFSDAILADYPVKRSPTHAVLTVYRPYPYAAGRGELMASSYGDIEDEVRREVVAGLGRHGLRRTDIEDVRLTRWGHPMIVARPGQLADETMTRAAAPQPGLYFAHTDVQGAPAYENAIAAAMDAAAEVAKRLG